MCELNIIAAYLQEVERRIARGFLAWDRRDLTKKALVTVYTVETYRDRSPLAPIGS
jgi:hypothetical protein